ncbi:MAG: transposase [Nitrospinaceae bacterium]|jgi:putative transposase|uniref:Transposase n=1 Tax=marine metagenome TaxID=408172 RepID=A0A382I2W2_9ZZZZ|nr:transposase [Candidatus Neomarinimicrobiota bacterium]MDP6712920.1 transposase [Nitrospinaceae bacterium]MDP7516376.1 transposase [Arenicellales bacterium]|tara:strand:+ start:110 stop:373 length:264 start_codon:yes stop_codon:yes gene_type:complete
MKRNRFTDEQIVAALRDAEATTVVEAARKHGVAEQTMYRWRKRFVGMEVSDVRELKRFKDENARLKKLLAERDLEVEVMKEIQAKKW